MSDTEEVCTEASEEVAIEEDQTETAEVEANEEVAAEEVPMETAEVEASAEVAVEEDQAETAEAEEYTCPPEFEEMEQMKKMFIRNIPKEATDDDLKDFFSKDPETEIANFEIVRKDPKIFAFITFGKCDDVDKWLQKRPLKVKERELVCKRAVAKDDTSETAHMRTKKIFFANVLPETTEKDIRDYLEKRHPKKFGTIDEIKLIKKKEGDKEVSKGYGFIMCENEDLADRISIGDRKCKIDPTSTKEQEFKKAWEKEKGMGGRGGRGGGRGSARGGARGARGGGYAQQMGGYGGGGYGQAYGWGMQGYGAGGYGGYGYGGPGPYGW